MPSMPRLYDVEVEKIGRLIRDAIQEGLARTRVGITSRSDCTEEQWVDMLRALLPDSLQTVVVIGESGRPYAVDIHWRELPNLKWLEQPTVPVISTVHYAQTPPKQPKPKRRSPYRRIRRLGPGPEPHA